MSTSQTWQFGDVYAENVGIGNHHTFGGGSPAEARKGPRPEFGIVTALPEEFAATRALLDDAAAPRGVRDDRADYVLGTLPSRDPKRPHRVVLTMLGETGNNAAAESCANLARSFGSVSTVVMSGIACGVPQRVSLGDIVVSTWGLVEYDHVEETVDGPVPRRPFPRPSSLLTHRAKYLQANEIGGERPWEHWLDVAERRIPAYARPTQGQPAVRYGYIGSANRSLRDARVRDRIAEAHDLLAIEMEGSGIGSAGFANGLEWFVVRGISDYGEHGTDGRWRGYASIAAAAYVRALLAECPPVDPRGGHTRDAHRREGPR
ncbi:5'-methylthioadenosine/S-adenosylhomocysteine nucleosidase family protein [Phytohabitans sp. LJ34]|uniref:5'-methylthioadenosine/S-adenosylhomocysteine nucleosidase family protein n=1 Tax=Phytohabitans sp. LJ34 TaxID=3452217 RepID=UPI003F89DCCE